MGYTMRDGVAYGGIVASTVLVTTLAANTTSVSFTDSRITQNERYNLYAEDKPLLKCTGISISGNTLTATFPAQTTATRIKLVINENTNSFPDGMLSYVGMVIESTTLDTEAKVKAIYGGTTWIQHSGYVLRGASSNVTSNSALKDGGSDDAVVVSHSHSVSVSGGDHRHSLTGPAGRNGKPKDDGTTKDKWYSTATEYTGYSGSLSMSGTAAADSNWSDGTDANIPNYKSVYIWERTV